MQPGFVAGIEYLDARHLTASGLSRPQGISLEIATMSALAIELLDNGVGAVIYFKVPRLGRRKLRIVDL